MALLQLDKTMSDSEVTEIALIKQRLGRAEIAIEDMTKIKTDIALILQKLSGVDLGTNNMRLTNLEISVRDIQTDMRALWRRILLATGGLIVLSTLVTALVLPYYSQKQAIKDTTPITRTAQVNTEH